jgi:protein-L-isoaspartate O-methyltransferase
LPTTRTESSDPLSTDQRGICVAAGTSFGFVAKWLSVGEHMPIGNQSMVTSAANMPASDPTSRYALGSTDAEHERLIRQAARLAPFTERFFRDAGIGPGQRVLDIGSGVGDVAMLAARIVGPSGNVVGVERDTRSITRARARVAAAALHNVTFTQSDV